MIVPYSYRNWNYNRFLTIHFCWIIRARNSPVFFQSFQFTCKSLHFNKTLLNTAIICLACKLQLEEN